LVTTLEPTLPLSQAIAKKDGVVQQIRHQLEEKESQFQQLNGKGAHTGTHACALNLWNRPLLAAHFASSCVDMFKKQREELSSMGHSMQDGEDDIY
jgi:hypothetical protein